MANCQKLVVNGGRRLEGELRVHGAKNSALPLLAACVLAHGECVLHNCPELTDVDAACRILSCLGCRCTRSGDTVCVDASNVCGNEIPDNLMREMRSSIVFLGAVLGRTRRCKLTFPGGCELGARPIDLHLAALRDMGVTISEEHGWLECTAAGGIRGGSVTLSFPSVGATENIMLAAVTASGRTEIHNAAYMTLAEGLVALGLLKGTAADAVASGAMTMLMPHGLGHGLGMDVHDCEAMGERSFDFSTIADRAAKSGTCIYRAAWRIEPGTVMTDEPGLYFIPALIDKCRAEGLYKGIVDYDALEAYRDFGGIRIEDDILVTEEGSRMLGDRKIPITVEELEAAVGR